MISRITQIDVNDIRFGTYKRDHTQNELVARAAVTLKRMPLSYVNITSKTWEEFLSIIRRWVLTKVGYDESGKIKEALVVYDYIKITDAGSLKANLAEYQQLGFLMSALHDITSTYSFPILTFAQLNREQDIASSMRILWYCSSYSVMSRKTGAEIGTDGEENGNISISPKFVRFGPGLADNDSINYSLSGKYSTLKELSTSRELWRQREAFKCTKEDVREV
jgi:hypothetical protein